MESCRVLSDEIRTMTARALSRSLMFLLMGSAFVLPFISACATTRVTPYPDDWPKLSASASCADLYGIYANVAEATASDISAKTPIERSYLASLLRDGTSGTHDTQQLSIRAVHIGAEATIHAELAASAARTLLQSSGQWSCSPAGLMTIHFEEETQSEYTVEQSVTIELTLHRATDRSLVIRQMITMHGVGQLFLPFHQESVNWKRFAAADAAEGAGESNGAGFKL